MKEIKILHMFSKLLSLYGEYGNLTVLKKALEHNGCSVEIVHKEDDFDDFSQYSLVYIGSGTEANIIEGTKRINKYADKINSYIENGGKLLLTGNAQALFGKSIEYNGKTYPGTGAFDYTCTMSDTTRFIGDALTSDKNCFGKRTIGFVNTSCVYKDIDGHVFTLTLGKTLGNSKQDGFDGFTHKNVFATQLIGPVLVKNPHILRSLCNKLIGDEITSIGSDYLEKAYDIALGEMERKES